jgi:hypothetical protein
MRRKFFQVIFTLGILCPFVGVYAAYEQNRAKHGYQDRDTERGKRQNFELQTIALQAMLVTNETEWKEALYGIRVFYFGNQERIVGKYDENLDFEKIGKSEIQHALRLCDWKQPDKSWFCDQYKSEVKDIAVGIDITMSDGNKSACITCHKEGWPWLKKK